MTMRRRGRQGLTLDLQNGKFKLYVLFFIKIFWYNGALLYRNCYMQNGYFVCEC